MRSSASRVWFVLALFSLSILVSCDSGGGTPEPDEPSEVSVDVTGTVTSAENDEPIGGASVEVLRADNGNTLASATTDTTGSYEVTFTIEEANAPDQLSVRASSEGFMEKEVSADFQSSVSRNVSLEEVETTEVTASGLVNRSDTGDPVTGATVTGSPDGGDEQLFETTTDERGEYEVTFEVRADDEPDQVTVEANAEDFDGSEQTVSFGSEISADLSLSPSEVTVTASGTITAELNDSTVEGAEVGIFRAGENGGEALGSTTSEMGGAYEVSFSIPAPDAPDELRLKATERRFDEATLTVRFSESIAKDIALPSIRISTIEELQAIQTGSDFPLDGFYVQTADIDASGTATQNGGSGFQPIGDDVVPFSGAYDGNGFAIESLTINRPDESPVGLFGKVASDGLLQNVFLQNVNVEGNDDTGGLAGENGGDIQSSSVTGNAVGVTENERAYSLGGLVGLNTGSVANSEADMSVKIRANQPFNLIGGLVGRNEGEIRDSDARGSVDAKDVVGGLVGYNTRGGEVSNSVAIGNVSGAFTTGGLVGNNDGDVQGSTAEGDVEGTAEVGGLIGGIGSGNVKGSVATGDVAGDTRIGGVAGENGGVVRRSKATGRVEGNSKVGGLTGDNSGVVEESIAIGNVSGSNLVGGLVGVNNEGEVDFSVAKGAVTGVSQVGGLVGGNIIIANGSRGSVVSSSYATGDVSGDDQVGALVGINTDDSNVDESFATGSASGNEDVGGLIGVNGSNVGGSYWDTEATGQNDGVGRGSPDGTTGLTTSEMQGNSAEGNMDGFDFQNTWRVVMGDYPALQWEE